MVLSLIFGKSIQFITQYQCKKFNYLGNIGVEFISNSLFMAVFKGISTLF